MPLKLTTGISKKVGLPAYSSVGASCQIERELASSVVDDPEALDQEIRRLYATCREAVEEELARCQAEESNGHASDDGDPDRAHGRHRGGNGVCPRLPAGNGQSVAPASARQREYLHALAAKVPDLDAGSVETLSQRVTGKSLAELSNHDATRLIDALLAARKGQLDLGSLLDADRR